MLRARLLLLLMGLALLWVGSVRIPHGLLSPSSFTFAIAGDFSHGAPATAVTTLWGRDHPSLSIGLGDYSYANTPPSTWCTSIWNTAVGSGDGFLVVGDHDTYYSDRLTNDLSFGYWENATGYANSCGMKGSGVNWTGSGTISNNHACNISTDLNLSDTCFGREMYVDYPASSPLVRFIVLCDGVPSIPNSTAWCDYGSTGTDASNHFAWLDSVVNQARQSGIPWVIVLNHDHSWAAGPYGISYSDALWNHLITDKVDVFITAEEHNYQRSYPLLCPTVNHDWYQNPNSTLVPSCFGSTSRSSYSHGNGLVYLISGTGGQSHNRFNTTDIGWVSNQGYFAALNDTSWGFDMFNVTSTSISATFNPAVGNFTDRWSISYPSTVGGTILVSDVLMGIIPFAFAAAIMVTYATLFADDRKRSRGSTMKWFESAHFQIPPFMINIRQSLASSRFDAVGFAC